MTAALDVLREGGFNVQSVRAGAGQHDTTPGALTSHIARRDELTVLVLNQTPGQAALNTGRQSWRASAEVLMRDMRRDLLDQYLPPSAASPGGPWGPNSLKILDAWLDLFLNAGLTNEQATYATTAVVDFVFGSASIQHSGVRSGPALSDGSDWLAKVLRRSPMDQFVGMRTAGKEFITAAADDVFVQGMTLVLDGITTRFFAEPRKPTLSE
jgi:TetR/AcrR family tetracycline transcriptional repressor